MAGAAAERLVYSVFHLTDLSPASEVAFAHALAIALVRGSELTLLHAGTEDAADDWSRFPAVRKTLERWGLLAPGSRRADVYAQLAVRVKKVQLGAARHVSAILDYLDGSPSELIVVAYDPKRGLTGVARDATAEDVARRSGAMTLFVPSGCAGFVSPDDGSLSLSRILVPIAEDPPPALAIEAARRIAEWLGDPPVEVTLLHVGAHAPHALHVEDDAVTIYRIAARDGDVVDEILAAAEEVGADLISMVTDGRSSLAEAIKGSHTERVVRRAPCPVLSLPESWSARVPGPGARAVQSDRS
jgi:nucleotide-binding universal stress UspA family protein